MHFGKPRANDGRRGSLRRNSVNLVKDSVSVRKVAEGPLANRLPERNVGLKDGVGDGPPQLLGYRVVLHHPIDQRALVFVKAFAEPGPRGLELAVDPFQIVRDDATRLGGSAAHADVRGSRPLIHVLFEFAFQILAGDTRYVRRLGVVFHAYNDPCELSVQSGRQPLRFAEQRVRNERATSPLRWPGSRRR